MDWVTRVLLPYLFSNFISLYRSLNRARIIEKSQMLKGSRQEANHEIERFRAAKEAEYSKIMSLVRAIRALIFYIYFLSRYLFL